MEGAAHIEPFVHSRCRHGDSLQAFQIWQNVHILAPISDDGDGTHHILQVSLCHNHLQPGYVQLYVVSRDMLGLHWFGADIASCLHRCSTSRSI